jgi:P pilus assembly chaperone PapD
VTISSNAPNSPARVALSGTGVAASLTLTANPGQLAFGSINAGSSSSKGVTVTNTGNTNVTISQITVSGKDVSASGITTPLVLAAGQAKVMNVSFSPTTAENVTGNVTATSSQGSSAVIAVSGTGVQAALGLNPSSVAFGSVAVGSANSQTVQVSNPGTGVLTISQVKAAGSGFSTNGITLPASINPGATSTFNVQYLPTAAGSVPGSVSIVSNAPSSPNAVALSGTGVAAIRTLAFTRTSIGFGNVATAGSVSESIGITNTGNSDVTISQIIASGAGFGVNGASTPVTLSPTQTLAIAPTFSPGSAGSVNGTVIVTSNATGSPATVTLTGTGVQPSSHTVALSWNASTSNVTGYYVYRTTTSGGGYLRITTSPLTSLAYVDDTVLSATTYFYVTTAVDENGIESSNSNEAQAIIP